MLEMIINDVANWHKEAFPDAEKESQIKKLEEELNEYYEKYDDLELADVFISSIIPSDKANRIVAEKMRINRLRKWRIVDGVYRHVESGEK